MRWSLLQSGVFAAGSLCGLLVLLPDARGDQKPRTIAPSEIKEGMKGYGLTVFKGTRPERFDVEVVGVLKNFRPSQDLILVKTPHPRLNITKNVKGMSGSPIYLDNGRLAGAYAYSWASFQVEPVAGVTPIAPMLDEMRRPIPPGYWPIDGQGPLRPASTTGDKRADTNTGTHFGGAPGRYDLFEHRDALAKRMPTTDGARAIVPVATPLMVGGVGERTSKFVRDLFEPLGFETLAAGGGGQGAEGDAPMHYENGGALGVAFVSGDVSFFGLGTVTHVEGNKVVGFGHPMMEIGTTAFPAAIGRVHWIFASEQHSSKIGEAARFLGTLTQDRQSAVVVDENVAPPTFPVSLQIRGVVGAPKTSWSMNVVEEKFMTPSLVASAFSGALEATANERRDVTWRLDSKLTLRGKGTLVFEDVGVATGGMPDAGDWARSRVVRALGDVLNNPWERVRIERIESVLSVEYTRKLMQLRGVDVLDPVVAPGKPIRVALTLVPEYGAPRRQVLELTAPAELDGKEIEIEVLPGYEINLEQAAPENFNQLLANMSKEASPRSVVLRARMPSQGVAYGGHVVDKLPPFALDVLRSQNSSRAPEPFVSTLQKITPLDVFITGRDRVKVKIQSLGK